MPDDTRTQQIEARIDREISGAIALRKDERGGRTIAPQNMNELFEFAKLMAISGQCVRPIFRGNPGACLAIALQAFRTGADPFAVANKAYQVNDQIAYEAQYIHAVINTSGQLKSRLRPTYSGEGAKRKCTVHGHVIGETEPLDYESPEVGAIPVKNSPLWKGDPDQQLFYYSSRAWARRHLPEVILGMYTREEIEPIDITPPPPRPRREEDYPDPSAPEPDDVPAPEEDPPQIWTVTLPEGELWEYDNPEEAAEKLTEAIEGVASADAMDALWDDNEDLIEKRLSPEAVANLRRVSRIQIEELINKKDIPEKIPVSDRLGTNPDPIPTSGEGRAIPRRRGPQASEATAPHQAAPEPETAPTAPPKPEMTRTVIVERTGYDPDKGRGQLAGFPPLMEKAPTAAAEPIRDPNLPPERPQARIEVPNDPRGKPDYRAWALVKFMPVARRAQSEPELAQLMGDYADQIEAYKLTLTPMYRKAFDDDIATLFAKSS